MKIIHDDKNFAVIDKPAGVIVHEGAGNTGKTLVDFILDKYPKMKSSFANPPAGEAGAIKDKLVDPVRIGIVHRLDKNTSGLIIVAKNPETQLFLQAQFKDRTINKTYLALVLGKVEPQNGKIVADIGRDQKNRLQQKVSPLVFSWTRGKTRPAETHYKVLRHHAIPLRQGFAGQKTYLSFLEVKPLTGRMHQIRVHLKYQGYPIIGDPIYNIKQSRALSKKLGLDRQFLHAYQLTIKLPDGENKTFKSDLPDDLRQVLDHISSR